MTALELERTLKSLGYEVMDDGRQIVARYPDKLPWMFLNKLATNWLDVQTTIVDALLPKNANRQRLSDLINDYLETPLDQR